jgi:hypothetical protein
MSYVTQGRHALPLVKSREMTGRAQTLPLLLGDVGLKTTEKKYIVPVVPHPGALTALSCVSRPEYWLHGRVPVLVGRASQGTGHRLHAQAQS